MDNNEIKTNPVEGKKSKKKLFIILGSILGAGAIAGASVGIYFATRPKTKNYFYFKNVGEEVAKFLTVLTTNETDPSKVFPDLHCSNDPNKDLSQWEKLSFGSKFEEGIYINTCELKPGDYFYFYGDNPNGINGLVDDTEFYFVSSLDGKPTNEKLAVGGNISSLVYGKEFENKNEVPNDKCYNGFFTENDKIITAKDLILPTAGCKNQCFNNMFYSCTNLEYAPYLGANTEQVSSTSCYAGMFSGCEKLKELKVNFGVNNIWPQGVHTNETATGSWLDNAGISADNPTFYWRGDNNPNIERSDDYVPEGWTILHWE